MKMIQKPSARDGWYLITPEDAADILGRRAPNRPLSESRARRIAADIAIGRYRKNGETLVFDTEGALIDGQTRARACVIARKPFESYCVFGVDGSVFGSFDQGRSRTVGDIGAILHFENYNTASAIAAWAIRYESGQMASTEKLSRDRVELFMVENRERIQIAAGFVSRYSKDLKVIIAPSLLGFVYYMATPINPVKAVQFVERLAKGTDLAEKSPILLLRKRLQSDRMEKQKLPTIEKMALLIKAWCAFSSGRQVGNLRWRSDGQNGAEQFPRFEQASK